ncbi:hypothetical protein FACS189426_14890 [Bacteroidia bacterium]|nr:hypothetical protein FACS189426_14890 [Bacteroidia bacterium]
MFNKLFIMKKYLTFLFTISILAISSDSAKANDDESVKALLFPQFEKGYVVLKEGNTRLSAQFNYDLFEERMLYLDEKNELNELNASLVAVVVIGNRSFFPEGNKAFYERIATGGKEYYIGYKTKVLSQGKAVGYGAYSQTASVDGVAISTNAGSMHLLGPDEKFDGIDESTVFIKNGKKFEKINSLKSLVKLFKPHQAVIETYSKENKTNFSKMENVKTIVEYALSL